LISVSNCQIAPRPPPGPQPQPRPAPRPPQPGPGTTTCNPTKLLPQTSSTPSKVTVAPTGTTSDFFTIHLLKQNK
jgi:hypothetical protein